MNTIDEYVGLQLGNYHIVAPLGEGGSARVYLGKHIHLGTYVAVKILHSHQAQNAQQKLRAEARILANLYNPHIVQVHEYGIDQGHPYLVMEYAPLGTVRRQYPDGSRLPLNTILLYVSQIAYALQDLHARKLIHQDVKPDNILLKQQRHILLSDLGITVHEEVVRARVQRERAGTALYMAPEQIRGDPCAASDQYALAIMVYEWLCGAPPFQGTSLQIMQQQLYTVPPLLCDQVPGLPIGVERAVLKALSKDPAQRFPSVRAFYLALRQAVIAQPAQKLVSPRPQPVRSARQVETEAMRLARHPQSPPTRSTRRPQPQPMRRRKKAKTTGKLRLFIFDLLFMLMLCSLLFLSGAGLYTLFIAPFCWIVPALLRAFNLKGIWIYILAGLILGVPAAIGMLLHMRLAIGLIEGSALLLTAWIVLRRHIVRGWKGR